MAKRVAVITDATSAGDLFPSWHAYYAAQFGAGSLYVFTYAGLGPLFSAFALGGVQELPFRYSDGMRTGYIAAGVAALLRSYDVVLRCDVDEFLVAHPRRHASLATYVEGLALPYVTARGIDLVEVAGDAPLLLDGPPILSQRRWAVRSGALSKTALTTIPLAWGPGFHAADKRPVFDDLFLVHTKFADVQRRVAWFSAMLDMVPPGSPEAEYFGGGKDKVESVALWLRGLDRRSPEEGDVFADDGWLARFERSVTQQPGSGLFYGDFAQAPPLCAIDLPGLF